MLKFETPQSICRFGLARCDITPPVGIYHRMWGAATHERATGVHQPLSASAMVFRPLQGDGAQVFVAVDHCLLWGKEMASLMEHLAGATSFPRTQIAVTFSHTHAAGLMDTTRTDRPGGEMIAPYLEELARRLARIINDADAKTRPATITYATGRCSLAGQRDLWDEDTRQFVCGFNPQAPADDTVLVARITGESEQTLATVVNYACHPTTLAWENTFISPDYPGTMRDVVEQATGEPCVFVQGASGDLGPREGFVGDTGVAERNGRQLGHAVLSVLESMPPPGSAFVYTGPVISGATLGAWKHQALGAASLRGQQVWKQKTLTVPLTYRADLPRREQTEAELRHWHAEEAQATQRGNDLAVRDAHAMIERMNRRLTRVRYLPEGDTFPMPVTLWRMGDAAWLGVEGEYYQAFQLALRQRFPRHPLVIATLTHGSRCSYLPPADAYGKGIYQESVAVLAPGCLERMIAAAAAELEMMLA